MPKILVAAYGGGHARLLIPVIRDLEARGHEVTVLGLTLGKAVFNQANITAVGLYDILQYSRDGANLSDWVNQYSKS